MKSYAFASIVLFLSSFWGNAVARSKSKMPVEPIKLYYLQPSPPSRAVIMTSKVLGLELDLIVTNILKGEHMTPEFLKMNPQHTIPTMDDGGFILWESRAILTYLVNAYGRDDSLYPKNPRQRAIVDQRLDFDLGTLYARYSALYVPMLFRGEEYNEAAAEKFHEALGWLDTYLDGRAFVAGENLTVADISMIVTLTNIDTFGFDYSAHENVKKWFERTKKILEPYGYNEIDVAGAQILNSFLKKEYNAVARSKSKMPMEPIKLYYLSPSPPCRAVMMTAKVLGLELDLIITNILKGENMTPEFLKMNPQHTIPIMDDGGFILSESRAILTYLANAYGRDDSLYPKNPRQRAIVDQRLDFDIGTLFARYSALYNPMLFRGAEYNEEAAEKLNEAFGWLDTYLDGRAFVAGENLTVADISMIVTLTNIDTFGFDYSAHENVKKWFERTKKILEPYGYNEIDVAGAQILNSFLKKE